MFFSIQTVRLACRLALVRERPPELVLLRGRRLLPSATLMETSGDVEVYLELVARTR